MLVVNVWFMFHLPEMEVKDLFASGFAPHSPADWHALEKSKILDDLQFSSYEQVWKEPQGTVETKSSGDSGCSRTPSETAVEPTPASKGMGAANGPSRPSVKLGAPHVGRIADDDLRAALYEAGWKAPKDFCANEDGSVELPRKGVHAGTCVPLLNALGFDGESVRSRIRGSMVSGGGRFSTESDRFLVEWSIAKDGGLEEVSVRLRTQPDMRPIPQALRNLRVPTSWAWDRQYGYDSDGSLLLDASVVLDGSASVVLDQLGFDGEAVCRRAGKEDEFEESAIEGPDTILLRKERFEGTHGRAVVSVLTA